MPNVVSNVTAGKPNPTGAIFRAPVGTTLPTDTDAPLDEAFVCLGFCSDDGVTNAGEMDSETIKAWGGQTVLVVSTEKPDTFQLTFLEALNANVLKTVYGDGNVTENAEAGTISVTSNVAALEDHVYVIDIAMRGGAMKRIVIPQGELSELGDIVYKDDEAVGYDVTVAANLDSSGNTHYEYIASAPTT